MHRILQLANATRAAHPNDPFFADLEPSLTSNPLKRRFYAQYNRAFTQLDPESWTNLLNKAVKHFAEKRVLQLKGPFFDQLTDAFAYHWLVSRGFDGVRVLREESGSNLSKQPDLSFLFRGDRYFCETKTINTSLRELQSRSQPMYRNSSRYASLHPTLLKKYDDAVNQGVKQIKTMGTTGLVFIMAWLDDFTMTYGAKHRNEIRDHLTRYDFPVVAKLGLETSLIEHVERLPSPRAA